MRTLVLIYLVLLAGSATADDLFVGVFETETRENFGSSTPGAYRIEVVAAAGKRYEATIYERGKLLGKQSLFPCPVEREGYFRNHPKGRIEVLCVDMGYGSIYPVLSYSDMGINVPAIKSKYEKNPELIAQEGLKPGDPSLFEMRHYNAKFYARVTWFFFAFKKVSS